MATPTLQASETATLYPDVDALCSAGPLSTDDQARAFCRRAAELAGQQADRNPVLPRFFLSIADSRLPLSTYADPVAELATSLREIDAPDPASTGTRLATAVAVMLARLCYPEG